MALQHAGDSIGGRRVVEAVEALRTTKHIKRQLDASVKDLRAAVQTCRACPASGGCVEAHLLPWYSFQYLAKLPALKGCYQHLLAATALSCYYLVCQNYC